MPAGPIIKEIQAISLLRKFKQADSWFLGRYGMNIYRGCSHDCTYCDGCAEKYQLTREVLQLLDKYNKPVHVLTKSPMVKRDMDILEKLDQKEHLLVSFSLFTVDPG